MEFGKLPTESLDLKLPQFDLSLPTDDPRSWVALKKAIPGPNLVRQKPRIGIGTPVWGVKKWVGKIYPKGTESQDFLYHYSRQFNSIELNSTHYHTPDEETIKRWREVTPEGFKFNVKFLQRISHRQPLNSRSQIAQEFIKRAMQLEDRLGITFLQLPPTFSPRDLGDLRTFLRDLPAGFPIAVEVRNEGFFEGHRLIAPLYDLLAAHGAHVVITDVAGRRDVLHLSLPTSRVLVRFIGNDLHPTDYTRIADWVQRLKMWTQLGLQQVEFFVHQPEDVNAPDLASDLIEGLNTHLGLPEKIKNWQPMDQGIQLGLF
jgi:uncharacterized protein YecE (DUF72 family)